MVDAPFATTVPVTSLRICNVDAAGGTVSTVTDTVADAVLVLPSASRTVTLSGWTPLLSAAVVKLHAPSAPAVTEPSAVVPS